MFCEYLCKEQTHLFVALRMDTFTRSRHTAAIYRRSVMRYQQGATAIEASLMLMTIMLAAALALEISHSSQIRHMATLALYQTGRVASVTQAHPDTLHATFSQAIAPILAAGEHSKQAQAQAPIQLRPAPHLPETRTQLPRWRLEVRSPSKASFKDFADPDLTRRQGRPVIRNSYLAQQHQTHLASGLAAGRGPASGQTIFQANRLELRLTFLYPPAVPGVSLLVKVLSRLGARRQDLIGQAWRQGLMVTVIHNETMMQSNLVAWKQESEPATRNITQSEIQTFNTHALTSTPQPSETLKTRQIPLRDDRLLRVPDPATPARKIFSETEEKPIALHTKNPAQPAPELCGVLLCCAGSD